MNDVSVTVIIPSLTGESENLDALKTSILQSGLPEDRLEVLTAVGIRPNGRARDVGALYASGDYLIFIDDDVSLPDPSNLRTIVEYLHQNPDVGLVGPAQQIPPSLPESIRNRALEMPRSHTDVKDTFTECDMVTHACMAIERETFLAVGMEHPNLISGTDPDLRNRVRRQGLKVGIVPETRVYHPPIMTWRTLVEKNFKGGRRSRAVKRNYESYHLPADPDIQSVETTEKLDTVPAKIRDHLREFLSGLLQGEFWWLTSQLCYVAGYLVECVAPARKVEPIPYPEQPQTKNEDWNQFLEALKTEGNVRRLHPAPEKTLDPDTDTILLQ